MNKLVLEVFCTLYGISAPSGLFLQQNRLYIVSDNDNYLYEYNLDSLQQSSYKLIHDNSGPQEQIPKNLKKDIEAITGDGEFLYLFGSGSTELRNSLFKIEANQPHKGTEKSLSRLYEQLREKHDISPLDFNIEGALFHESNLFLFNRGNGPKRENGIFTLDKSMDPITSTWTPITLPSLNNIPSGFTDASYYDHKIYFVAAAEEGESTFDDGDVGGSIIGALDINSMELIFAKKVSGTKKLEGITLLKDENNYLTFLLCEDPDSEVHENIIYSLKINKVYNHLE